MIRHHQQAIRVTQIVVGHAQNPKLKTLAARIMADQSGRLASHAAVGNLLARNVLLLAFA